MTSSPQTSDRSSLLHDLFGAAPSRIAAMLLLFVVAAVFEARNLTSLSAVSNDDTWWHIRTGLWILQNHALPRSGLFSLSPQLPWTPPSWGYDVLVALGWRMLGLRSLPLTLMILKLAVAVAAFLLAGGLRGQFWPAVFLSAITQFILGSLPALGCCSMVFFSVELLVLQQARRNGTVRSLFWLPPLFLLWANMDVQFVLGILLLALFLAASLVQNFIPRSDAELSAKLSISSKNAAMVAALCVIATFVTPCTYHLYGVFWGSVSSTANKYLPDFHAMGFRQPQDYALMLLTMTAFLALGMRRSRDLFQIALMIGCTILSFSAQRYGWLVALASIYVIGEAIPNANAIENQNSPRASRWQVAIAGAASLTIVILAAQFQIPRGEEALLAKAAQAYPVAASNYIREHQLPRPLFNACEWGGFLTWYLPEYPVAIDSRPALYEDDFIVQYFKAMNADTPYQSYPAMASAGTLLLRQSSLMGEALRTLPAFRVAYSDNVAVVLVKP